MYYLVHRHGRMQNYDGLVCVGFRVYLFDDQPHLFLNLSTLGWYRIFDLRKIKLLGESQGDHSSHGGEVDAHESLL